MKHKILITGCAGFIGFHLSKLLISKGYDVKGLDNLNDYYDVNLKKNRLHQIVSEHNFEFHKIDLLDKKQMDDLFKNNNFTCVVHLAAQAGVRYSLKNPQAYIDTNITGYVNMLELCKEYGIKLLLYASSSSVYGDCKNFPLREDDVSIKPISLYGTTKKFNEELAFSYFNLYRLNTIGLRFFTVYGPWGRPDMALFKFTKNIIENQSIDVYNKGNHSRSFTYVDDIINAIELLLIKYLNIDESINSVLNIGGDKSIELLDFINLIERKLNKKATIKLLEKQPGDVERTESNCDKIKSLVEYKPKVSINDGIENFINWYKSYYKIL